MKKQIEFVSSNKTIIKRLDYVCERDIQNNFFTSYATSHVTFHGNIHFYSSKEIDFRQPFCVSMINMGNNCVANINNIWLTDVNYKRFDYKYFEYEAGFQAENIKYGNLKSVYLTFLRK